MYEESEDDGTRTRNHRRDKPMVDAKISYGFHQKARADERGRSAGRSDQQSEGGTVDAELGALVAAWPHLPEHIRAAIRALVVSAGA